MTIRYKGYASENLPQIPNAVDLSKTIEKRNKEYIESLKFLREFAGQQDAAMLKDFEEQQTRLRKTEKSASDSYLKSTEAVIKQKSKNLENIQKNKAATIGASGQDDNKVEALFKGIADFSTTAANAIGNFAEQKIEADKKYGQMMAAQNPYNPTVLGINQQNRDLKVGGSYIEAQAAQLDLQGRKDEADKLRGLSGWRKVSYNQAMAKSATQGFTDQVDLFWQQNPDTELLINGKTVKAKDLDRGDSTALHEAYLQSVPDFMERAGFGDAKPEALVEAYNQINSGISTAVGTVRTAEINNNNENLLNKTTEIFYANPNGENLRTLYQTVQNFGKSDSDTRKQLKEILANTSLVNDDQFDELGDVPLGVGLKGSREQYSTWWTEVKNARDDFDQANFTRTNQQTQREDKEFKDKLVGLVEADRLDDGDVDLTQEQWKQLEIKMIENDYSDSLQFWNNIKNSKYLASDYKDQQLETEFARRLAMQVPITSADVYNSGGSFDFINKWTKEISTANASLMPPDIKTGYDDKVTAEINGQKGVKEQLSTYGPEGLDSSIGNAIEYLKKKGYEVYGRAYRASRQPTEQGRQDEAYLAAQKFLADQVKLEKFKVIEDSNSKDIGTLPEFSLDALTKNVGPSAYQQSAYRERANNIINNNRDNPNITRSAKLVNYYQMEQITKDFMRDGSFTNMPSIVTMIAGAYPGLTAGQVILNQMEAHQIKPPPALIEFQQKEQEAISKLPAEFAKLLTDDPNFHKSAVVAIQETGTSSVPYHTANQTRLLNTLAATESSNDTRYGGYDAMNTGGGFDANGKNIASGTNTGENVFGKPLQEMTIQQILDLGAAKKIFAAGRYQFIPSTLADEVKNQGIPLTAKFSRAVQDFLAINYWRKHGNTWRKKWLGPAQHGTPEEQQFLDSMVGNIQSPQNPTPWAETVHIRPELRGQ